METSNFGKWLVIAGGILAIIGLVIWLLNHLGIGIGKLPGDIKVEKEGFTFYSPLTSSIIISIVLTIIINVVLWIINRKS